MTIRATVGCRLSALATVSVLAAALTGYSIAPVSAQQPASSDPVAQALNLSGPAAERPAYRRWKYFYEQRAFPFDSIPPDAYARARQYYEQTWGTASRDALPPAFAQNQWTGIGPAPIGSTPTTSGRINSIAIHPTNVNIIYIAAADGGVWRSTDGGATWTALTDSQCSLSMGAIALDPVNPNIVYAGTGEHSPNVDAVNGCGLLRSTDGGDNWAGVGGATFPGTGAGPLGGASSVAKIVIDPASAGSTTATKLLAATGTGLFRSTDSGATWARVLPTPAPATADVVTDVVIDPSNPLVVYAAVGNFFGSANNGIYKSTDGGATFPTKLAGGFPTVNVGRINLDIAKTATQTLYAAVQDSLSDPGANAGGLLGVFQTTNGGTTWAPVTATNASCNVQCWYDMGVSVDPTNANIVYFSGFSLYRSTNGGASFTDIGTTIHVDHHAFAFLPGNPTTFFAGSDGGIFKSIDSGANWTSLNTNLAITQFYAGVALHPTNAAIVMGGTQDNGTIRTTGALAWGAVIGGDGGFAAIDFTTPATAYGETQWTPPAAGNPGGPRRSDNVGVTAFNLKTTGINLNDPGQFIPPLVMSPSNALTLYFGTNKVYKTIDRGENWTPGPVLPGTVTAIAQAPNNANVIYAGTSTGSVQLSTNGGGAFTPITTGLPVRAVTYLAVNPLNANEAFVTFSGFNSGHVFKTINQGANWTDISGNLPNVPFNSILLDPAAPTTEIFVGSDFGAFRTSNGGGIWTAFNNGLPNVAVRDLVFKNNTLVAGTHGRSAFKANVSGGTATTVIVAAVLPNARTTSFPNGAGVTGFATILNTTATAATQCFVSLPSGVPAILHYRRTNAQNVVVGFDDVPFDIPGNAGQSLVFGITPLATFTQNIALVFQCSNSPPAPTNQGVNTFLVSVGSTAIPDMLAIGDTLTHDGIAHIPGVNGQGYLATAAIDIGAAGQVTCVATPTPPGQPARTLAATLSMCQTDAQANCTNPAAPGASSTLNVVNNQTVFFSVFIQGQGQTISLDPANKRVFLVCSQGAAPGGTVVGETSVAVCTGTVLPLPGTCN